MILPAVSRVVTVALTSPFAANTDPGTLTLQVLPSGIHCRLVGLGTDFHGDCIARFDIRYPYR
ncbi:hypothetical protein KCQ_00015, partial [Pectobacterium atrosepticum ICMP 1526]